MGISTGKREKSEFDEKYFGSGVHFKNALNKYGKENFAREILEWCADKETLSLREKYWIKKLDARNPEIGYNIAEGGQCGYGGLNRPRTEEEKIKISKGKKGIPCTETQKQKMSGSHKGKPKPEWFSSFISNCNSGRTITWADKISKSNIGRKDSDETKQKKSIAKLGNRNKPAKQTRCIETGEIFRSSREAALAVNRHSGNISYAIRKGKTCAGYHWEYLN